MLSILLSGNFPFPMKNFKVKIITLGLGLLVILLLLELGLRILGGFYHKQIKVNQAANTKPYTILCLGDSFTYGIGAPPEQSYPAQLENLLNAASHKSRKFLVVNGAQLGSNSSQILSALPDELEKIKPRMVILMIGLNNVWNYVGYYEYSKANNWITRAHNLLYQLKLYKLGLLLSRDLRTRLEKAAPKEDLSEKKRPAGNEAVTEKFKLKAESTPSPASSGEKVKPKAKSAPQSSTALKQPYELDYNGVGWAFMDKKKYKEAIKWFKKGLTTNPFDAEACYGLAIANHNNHNTKEALPWLFKYIRFSPYVTKGKYPEVINLLKAAIASTPEDAEPYKFLGLVYLEKYDYNNALKYFKYAADRDPNDEEAVANLGRIWQILHNNAKALQYYKKALLLNSEDTDKLIASILQIYEGGNDYEGAVQFFESLTKIKPEFKPYLELFKKKQGIDTGIEKWLKDDIEKMLKLCQQRNITLVLMDYPRGIIIHSGLRSQILKRTAARNELMFVDNVSLFKNLPNQESYFMPDGHCNSKGYGVIAQNAYAVIKPLLP
jgi:tetratricopeptide (TPR) repeat protein